VPNNIDTELLQVDQLLELVRVTQHCELRMLTGESSNDKLHCQLAFRQVHQEASAHE